jgi:diacylglycerol kinase
MENKQNLLRSFFSAFRGIKHELRGRNFVILVTAGIMALSLSLALKLPRNDKIIIMILVAFVLASEAINSACERMLDLYTKEHNIEVARIKEILAGAVLIYSVTAFIIGIWIFGNAIVR